MFPSDLLARDRARESLPGEHWVAAVTGAGLLIAATRPHEPALRCGLALLGGALLARAASGRDGPVARLRRALGDRPRVDDALDDDDPWWHYGDGAAPPSLQPHLRDARRSR